MAAREGPGRVKIAIVHNLPSGGARRALGAHARGLVERGHAVEVFAPSTADESFHPVTPPGSNLHVFAAPVPPGREASLFGKPGPLTAIRGARLLRALYRIHRDMSEAVDRGGFDVVLAGHDQFTHSPLAMRWLRTPVAYYCQEPLRFVYDAPVGLDTAPRGNVASAVRSVATAAARRLLGPIDRTNVAGAGRILANSFFSHESIMRAYGRSAQVVYLGIDTGLFRPLDLPRERFVLSVGALHPAKGFDFIVGALARIDEARRPRLVIVADRGYGVLRTALERLAAESKVALDIHERIPDDQLVSLMNRAGAVVYAPYLEPFGFVPLEAMACGTAVVSVAEGGVRESVVDGETGLLVSRDHSAFAATVSRVLDDAALARRLGDAGRKSVGERWTWAASCEQLERELAGARTW